MAGWDTWVALPPPPLLAFFEPRERLGCLNITRCLEDSLAKEPDPLLPEGLKGKSSLIKEDQKLKAKLEGKKGQISLKWTTPGGTAIPARSAAKVEQALALRHVPKSD